MEFYPMVPISDEEWRSLCKPWKEALVINTLGLKLNVKSLKPRLARIWKLKDFELIDLANNYYIVRTEDPSHYSRILNDGPWVILDHCVLVQRWTPDFNPTASSMGKIALWIRLSNIPIQCYNRDILWRMGNCVGKTLKVDPHTLTHNGDGQETTERGKYVRISVEVDLRKKLIPRLLIRDELFNVEYESLSLICFSCGTYGHNRTNCPHDPKNQKQNETLGKNNSIPRATDTNQKQDQSFKGNDSLPKQEYGEWMHVRRQKRAQSSRYPPAATNRAPATVKNGKSGGERPYREGNNSQGSRFDILASEEGQEAEIYAQIPKQRAVTEKEIRDHPPNPNHGSKGKKIWRAKVKPGEKRGRTYDPENAETSAAENGRIEKRHEQDPSHAPGNASSHFNWTGPVHVIIEDETMEAQNPSASSSKTRIHRVIKGSKLGPASKPITGKQIQSQSKAHSESPNDQQLIYPMNPNVWGRSHFQTLLQSLPQILIKF